jgi:hypothetical protein
MISSAPGTWIIILVSNWSYNPHLHDHATGKLDKVSMITTLPASFEFIEGVCFLKKCYRHGLWLQPDDQVIIDKITRSLMNGISDGGSITETEHI